MGEKYETMAEIEKRYDGQWVLIDRPRKGKTPDVVLGGYVVYHGPDRMAGIAAIDRLPRPFDIAYLYFGRWPDDESEPADEDAA